MRRETLITLSLIALVRGSLFGYGQDGHEIVGAIADKLIQNTPAGKKIYALTDGITLRKAAFMPDEIKAWDKNGPDDPNTFPHYSDHPKIDRQMRDFWRANPPNQDPESAIPSHHWFHYTDVPVLNPHKYADGKTGRKRWDIVHMISYCVDVLRGEIPENNPRKITKPVAVILLAHYVGDIHQPLHVGAGYFKQGGQAADPDAGEPGIEDEGGNTMMLRLFHGTSDEMAKRGGLKLHGFWDNEAVMANLPPLPADISRQERYEMVEPAKRKFVEQLAQQQPNNWRAPSGVSLKNYGEFWADEILPIAREAHERLEFINVHQTTDQERIVMAGDVREKNTPDRVGYADWAAKTVRDELQKAGWRLADLLTQAVDATPMNSSEQPVATPTKNIETVSTPIPVPKIQDSASRAVAASQPTSQSAVGDFGDYPANYKEVVSSWMQKYGLDSSQIDWKTEPRTGEMPSPSGQTLSGYVVTFNTPDHGQSKTRGVLIRSGVIVANFGFEK